MENITDEISTNEDLLQDNKNNDEENIISQANNQYTKKNYIEALNLFLSSNQINSDAEICVNIGSCYYMLHKQEDALKYWNKAIGINPKNSKAYSNMGNMYYKTGQIESAISYWLVALISRPEDANTSLNLAIAFNQKNMRFEAIKYFERYIKYAEEQNSAKYLKIRHNIQNCLNIAQKYLTAGVELQMQNQNKRAAACYFKSLANYPNFSKTNLNLGSIFFADKNLTAAIKYWKRASHIDSNYAKIYSNLGIAYDLGKEFDYAYCYYYRYMNYIIRNRQEYYKINKRLMEIKIFLTNHPELISKHLKMAENHIANSEFYEAIDEFRNYAILKPEEKDTYKDIIEKLLSYLNPEVSIIKSCFEIGNKLITEGSFSEAKPYFLRIMRLSSPQNLEFSKARAKYSQCQKAESGFHA
jgi:tetratricopeptide (TPR) repeat protein